MTYEERVMLTKAERCLSSYRRGVVESAEMAIHLEWLLGKVKELDGHLYGRSVTVPAAAGVRAGD